MSTPEDTSPEKKPEDAAVPTDAAKTLDDAAAADSKPSVAKPKFKVTRSPFAPKVEGAAAKPGPINLSKPGAPVAKPTPVAPKPAPAAEASAEAPKPVAPKPIAPKAPAPKPLGVAPKAQAAPTAPKPVAPVSARKAAELAEEEDSKFSPILMAVDAIAAIVAISFGVLIILSMKG